MELNSDASDFAAEYTYKKWGVVHKPSLDKASCRRAATSFFMSFFMNDAYARLTDLEVRFIREEGYDDTNIPIKIRRLERNVR